MLPYINKISEGTARHFAPFENKDIAPPNQDTRNSTDSTKRPLGRKGQVNGIYDIQCQVCDGHYVGETRKRLETLLKQHQSAAERHCPLSQIHEHMLLARHIFNFDEAKMIATFRRKGTRLILESWLSENKAINRRSDRHPAYQALRHSRKKIKLIRRLTKTK